MSTDTSPMYGWEALPWHRLERRVFKLQKRIYRATRKSAEDRRGMHDKHPIPEERNEGKPSRSVLEPSRGGDTPA